jgi:23S rRNA (guanosine2251-2'-O)-methyltransferase
LEAENIRMMKEEFIFGTRAVLEAIRSGKNVDKVLIRNGLSNDLFGELYQMIKDYRIPFQYVPVEKLDRITRKNHQGIIALLSPIDFYRIEDILPSVFEKGEDPLILILDQITDVRNFGAIVRSCECAGVHAVVIPEKGAARIGEDAMKTSAGALNFIPVCRTVNLNVLADYLHDAGLSIIAATEKAENVYTAANMKGPLAVIVGSEESGISPSLLRKADQLVKIPVLGKIGSLNVSVAASLVLYEAIRQRGNLQE